MKYFIISTLFTGLLLAGCSESEIDSGKHPGGDKAGFSITARVSPGKGTVTRAVGDAFTAGKEEKRIDRLAFFVHTAADGFQVYPPVPDAEAAGDKDAVREQYPNNVYLSGDAENGYTALVTLTAGGGYTADIIAIANLPHDYDYKQIVTWKGLCDSVAVWNAAMPACLPGSAEADLTQRKALTMYGYTVKELIKEEENPVSFSMERLVARIDITNEAYVSGATPTNHGIDVLGQNGFLLTSVKLLRAKPAVYLVPKPDASPDVETINTWLPLNRPGTDILYGKSTAQDETANPTREPDEVAEADVTDATVQYAWHTLYTNPNEDTEHAPTSLEIKGWFRGTEITRQIAFVDKDKNPFPIVGNNRYLVRIAKAPGQTDIAYSITVSQWDAVDTVNVKPDQTAKPKIEAIKTNMTSNKIDPGIKAYDLYYTQNGTISIDALCSFAPDVRVKYYNTGTDTWQAASPYEADWLTITKSDPELVPATRSADNVYKRTLTVACKPFTSGLSRKVMLLVHNGGSEVECDTVYIRQTLTYPGTDLEPVAAGKLNSTDIIWAPVNCGATEMPTSVPTTGDITSTCGNFYQWGRKYGFPANADLVAGTTFPTITGNWPTQSDLLTLEDEGSPWAGKFILSGSTTPNNTESNWLQFVKGQDNPSSNVDDSWYQKLWNDGDETNPVKTVYDPCPAGWRVPTKTEWDAVGTIGGWGNGILTISGLVLPAMGHRHGSLGVSYNQGTDGVYWSSSMPSGNVNASLVGFGSVALNSNTGNRSYGFSVRCVQE